MQDVILFDLPVRPGGPRKPVIVCDCLQYAKEASAKGMSKEEASDYALARVRDDLLAHERYQSGVDEPEESS